MVLGTPERATPASERGRTIEAATGLLTQSWLRALSYSDWENEASVAHPHDWQLLFYAADPHVLFDSSTGLYHLTCLATSELPNSIHSIVVRSAPDLSDIGRRPNPERNQTTERLLKVSETCAFDEEQQPCDKQVWAPELNLESDGSYTLRVSMSNGQNQTHDVYVFQASSLDETFQFLGRMNVPGRHWAIDGTVVNVDKQQLYFWSGWENQYAGIDQSQHIYLAEMLNQTDINGERIKLFSPTLPWTRSVMSILEGVQGAQYQGQTWGGTVAANISWGTQYTTGLFYRDYNEDPLTPPAWVMDPKPLFSGPYGAGHGTLVEDTKDSDYFFFAGHTKLLQRTGWEDRVAFLSRYKVDEVLERRLQVLQARPANHRYH